ncbi:hypothetical protein EHYA_03670 [Embleya hyalina]|uniref:Uncharacterized protein n=1 Tax=Embleya hyalina TaxID=516124 RepID=A0A401YN08_9ACTN|nr:hypothetical protein EHYA_03670 [Embleya hyalina]
MGRTRARAPARRPGRVGRVGTFAGGGRRARSGSSSPCRPALPWHRRAGCRTDEPRGRRPDQGGSRREKTSHVRHHVVRDERSGAASGASTPVARAAIRAARPDSGPAPLLPDRPGPGHRDGPGAGPRGRTWAPCRAPRPWPPDSAAASSAVPPRPAHRPRRRRLRAFAGPAFRNSSKSSNSCTLPTRSLPRGWTSVGSRGGSAEQVRRTTATGHHASIPVEQVHRRRPGVVEGRLPYTSESETRAETADGEIVADHHGFGCDRLIVPRDRRTFDSSVGTGRIARARCCSGNNCRAIRGASTQWVIGSPVSTAY